MITLDAVRVARCNLHDVHSRDGISVFLPRVQFLQLIKPSGNSHWPLFYYSSSPSRVFIVLPCLLDKSDRGLGTTNPRAAPLVATLLSPQQPPSPLQQPQQARSSLSANQPWLEAGSLGFGPVHLHSGISGLDHAYRDPQLAFIRRHDAASRRLWFFWLPAGHLPASSPSTKASAAAAAVRCGCYGNCAFFGPNASGKMLLDEVTTGVFSRRAVFGSEGGAATSEDAAAADAAAAGLGPSQPRKSRSQRSSRFVCLTAFNLLYLLL